MAIQRRNILGPSADNGAKAPSYAPGGDDSLSARQPYTAPLTVTDQTSAQTEAERGGLESSFREAQRVAGAFADAGAAGTQLGRGPDTFSTRGTPPTDGPGDVVAPEPSIVTRTDGADSGIDGTGKALGA